MRGVSLSSVLTAAGVLVILACQALGQTRSPDGAANLTASQIVDSLIPDGVAEHRLLSRFPRSKTIGALRQAQGKASGIKRTAIAFLLAYLNHDYAANRDRVVSDFRACFSKERTEGCAEIFSDYLIVLFEKGDASVLNPLMRVAPKSDGHLSEILGVFYGVALWKRPIIFLSSLSREPLKTQRLVGWLAATADGAGIEPKRAGIKIRARLKQLSNQPGEPLSRVSAVCLKGFDEGLAAVRDNR